MLETSQKRRYPRLPARQPALLMQLGADESEECLAITRSMSLGGCEFESREPLNVDAVLELLISAGHRVFSIKGQVVYTNYRKDGRYDVGVKFLDIGPDEREAIRGLLNTP